jgi:peroxiredoxin
MAALEKGADAPPFKLEDLEGQAHSIDELQPGDLLLAVFYHSECPTCQLSMPFIGNLARGVRSPRVKLWGVSQDDAKTTLKFARDKALEMPILVDADPYPVSQAYGLTNVPTLFLIDSGRRVIDQCVGFSKADFVRIAETLAGHAGAAPLDIFAGREVPAMAYG